MSARLVTNLVEAPEPSTPRPFTPPPGAIRCTPVLLTPLAPGCGDILNLSDHRRWRHLIWKRPDQTLRLLLARLRRRADQVAVRAYEGLAGTEIHDAANDPGPNGGCAALLAIVFEAPPAALAEAHAALLSPNRSIAA